MPNLSASLTHRPARASQGGRLPIKGENLRSSPESTSPRGDLATRHRWEDRDDGRGGLWVLFS